MQVQDAQLLAADELKRRCETSEFWRKVDDLSELLLANETPDFRVFFSGSRKLAEASHVPGGMYIAVDKYTGRIWTREDIQAYYTQRTENHQPIAA